MTKIYHQVSQNNWLDDRGLSKKLSKTPDKRLAKDNIIHQLTEHEDEDKERLGIKNSNEWSLEFTFN